MSGMYKDAKDWLEQNAETMKLDTLVSFILNEVSNDDIERWFGVNMEDDSDNPGTGMIFCKECRTEVDESDYDADLDMCNDCVAEQEEEAAEEADDERRGYNDPNAFILVDVGDGVMYLRESDFDYQLTDWRDSNIYPWYDDTTPVDKFGTPYRTLNTLQDAADMLYYGHIADWNLRNI